MRMRLVFGALLLILALAWPVQAQLGEDDRLLAWVAPVSDPFAPRSDEERGQLGFIRAGQTFDPIQDVPEGTNRVAPCGAEALSPNGQHFAFIMGNDSSPRGVELYLMTGSELPRKVADLQAVGCLGGNGRFQYSPDSRRLAYIAYPANWADTSFALGELVLHQTDSLEIEFTTTSGGVVAFDLTDEGLTYLRFITNSQGQATQAEVNVWSGGQPRIPVTINAGPNCRYISSYILDAGETAWVGLAERCNQTNWRLFRVDKAQENAVLALTTQARGAFSGGVETHTLRLANTGESLLYSLPSGRTQNSAFWYQIPLDDIRTPQALLELDSMMLDYGGGVDAAPAASPDGRWLAFVTREGNSSSVQLLDLENPAELPDPILATRNQGEAIQWLAFTPDSRAVVFIAGQSELRGNALYYAEVGQTSARTVTAGTFSTWAIISPSQERIAVLEWQPTPVDRPAIDPYLNLVVVDLEDGAREALFDGLVIDASDDASLQFALPLWWGD